MQLAITNLEQHIARTNACRVSGATFVNILEHPARFTVESEAHERGADRVSAGDVRAFRVSKTCVARL